MRTIYRSAEFDEYYLSQPERVRSKIDYALSVIQQIRVVNSKLVKKIEHTDFYEMRISVDNEHRVFMFSIDNYKSQYAIAQAILSKYIQK